MSNIELRFNDVEFSTDENEDMIVEGYVNKTEQLSQVLGTRKKFQEKISKGAFKRSLEENSHDVHFLLEHDPRSILSSTRNDSLQLSEDENGLKMRAKISPTSWGKDAYQLIKDGIFRGMSFGFNVVNDTWKNTPTGIYERTIKDLKLFEVSVVRDPAYAQSVIEARGIDVVDDEVVPDNIEDDEKTKEDKKKMDLEKFEERFNNLESKFDKVLEEIRSVIEAKPENPTNVEVPDKTEDPTPEDNQTKVEDPKQEDLKTGEPAKVDEPVEDPKVEDPKSEDEPKGEDKKEPEKVDPEDKDKEPEKRSLDSYTSVLETLKLLEDN